MLFNSFLFWLFFAFVALCYFRLQHRGQNWLLLISSYLFYGCWDWRFLSLIAISTLIDYHVALKIASTSNRTRRFRWLMVSVCCNLGILGFFKYFNFFCTEFTSLLNAIGLSVMAPGIEILLPVGISFYTFQTMSYTIDVYRRDCKPTRDLLNFAVYVSFFPQLVAGPIERAAHFLPQVCRVRTWDEDSFAKGLQLVILGLFRKIFIADNMALIANAVFATPASELDGVQVMIGIYAFAFQIYGDFSGYSAIARGISVWLGFDLMVNFRRPYFAQTPSEFWQRWHISLSQWLRDYLYIPLGGNRLGTLMTYRNLMLTMLLGGLWHGANWTFIAWGTFQGVLLCGYRVLELSGSSLLKKTDKRMTIVCRQVILFHLVCVGWLLFRADSFWQVTQMIWAFTQPVVWNPATSTMLGLFCFVALPLLAYEFWEEYGLKQDSLLGISWLPRAAVYASAMHLMIYFPPEKVSQFIYFQF